jgi:hypothetical protein
MCAACLSRQYHHDLSAGPTLNLPYDTIASWEVVDTYPVNGPENVLRIVSKQGVNYTFRVSLVGSGIS